MSFPSVDLTPVAFETLAGFDADDLDAALAVFRRSAERLIAGQPAQRPARPPPAGLIRAAQASLSWNAAPIAYVRDAVELFLLQVQGSGRLRLADDETLTLTYDGRNGWPYTSIGKLLIAQGRVPEAEMSLARLKSTLRDLGLATGAPGRRLMQENRSYVFFRIDDSAMRRLGPIGGAGCALTPLRSIAIDRALWCYGLPFWIAVRVPWEKDAETRLERLMIGQDTGSAIVGPARADLFFGAGPAAGRFAGRVRHNAEITVFLPVDDAS